MKMKYPQTGFSAIELMVVLAIIIILATVAVPSGLEKFVKEQVNTALPLADVAKAPVSSSWATLKLLPANNAEAGLPAPDKVVSNFVSSVEIAEGAIHMTFGNKAAPALKGKVISFRPAVIEDSQVVPVAWVCGNAKAPEKMIAKGENRTSLDASFLPNLCR